MSQNNDKDCYEDYAQSCIKSFAYNRYAKELDEIKVHNMDGKRTITVDHLIAALVDNLWYVRLYAIKALYQFNDERVLRAFSPLLVILDDKNEDEVIRCHAAVVLGKIGGDLAIAPLLVALRYEYGGVRRFAAKALGDIKNKSAVTGLLFALNDENKYVREAAAVALGNIKDERAISPLINALNDKYDGMREAAARALGWVGDKRAISPLLAIMEDENEKRNVRWSSIVALGFLGDEATRDALEAARKVKSTCGVLKHAMHEAGNQIYRIHIYKESHKIAKE